MDSLVCSIKLSSCLRDIFATGFLIDINKEIVVSIICQSKEFDQDKQNIDSILLWFEAAEQIFQFSGTLKHASPIRKLNNLYVGPTDDLVYYVIAIHVAKIYTAMRDVLHTRNEVTLIKSSPLLQGGSVVYKGSPLGAFSPQTLINCEFHGILSKVLDAQAELLLIDAFTPVGVQGSPVFLLINGRKYLYGMLMADDSINLLTSRQSYPTGTLCTVVSIFVILRKVYHLLENSIHPLGLILPIARHYYPLIYPLVCSANNSIVDNAIFDNIVYIENPSKHTYFTGYILPGQNKLCITCAHSVRPTEETNSSVTDNNNNVQFMVHIKIRDEDGITYTVCPYMVLWSTRDNLYPDLALLAPYSLSNRNIDDDIQHIINCNALTDNYIIQKHNTRLAGLAGEQVLGIGFNSYLQENYSSSHSIDPIITNGNVLKVITCRDRELFYEVSCSTHPGCSGGLVISRESPYTIRGVMSGYIRYQERGVHIDYFRLCRVIPFSVIMDILQDPQNNIDKYLNDNKMQDLWNISQHYNLNQNKL